MPDTLTISRAQLDRYLAGEVISMKKLARQASVLGPDGVARYSVHYEEFAVLHFVTERHHGA